jgi:hypothetical protein
MKNKFVAGLFKSHTSERYLMIARYYQEPLFDGETPKQHKEALMVPFDRSAQIIFYETAAVKAGNSKLRITECADHLL